jgi:hypothetical protein
MVGLSQRLLRLETVDVDGAVGISEIGRVCLQTVGLVRIWGDWSCRDGWDRYSFDDWGRDFGASTVWMVRMVLGFSLGWDGWDIDGWGLFVWDEMVLV